MYRMFRAPECFRGRKEQEADQAEGALEPSAPLEERPVTAQAASAVPVFVQHMPTNEEVRLTMRGCGIQ